MSEARWTDEQLKIFDAQGNVLVSASAGSGKTTVMVTKIVDLLLKNTGVEEVLVLSYTNASAADMRMKIIDALYNSVRDRGISGAALDRVREQLDNLPFADIGTMDGFFGKLIRENFEALEISPSFIQMDKAEADEMKLSAVGEVIAEAYESGNREFLDTVDRISDIVDDLPLYKIILRLYDAICIHPDPEEFKKKLLSAADIDSDGEYGKIIMRHYRQCAHDFSEAADRLCDGMPEDFGCYRDCAIFLAHLFKKIVAVENVGQVMELVSELELIPSLRTRSAADEDTRSAVKYLKKYAQSIIGGLRDSLIVDYKDFNVSDARRFIKTTLSLIEGFDQRYSAEKRARNKVDFQDLSRLATRVLSDESRASAVAKRYKCIFVDEYQDINPLQEYALKKLSRGNLFMVGDSKQSIYAFRNADTEIFLDKKERFERGAEGVALNMTVNHRSTKAILGFADRVFSAIMTKDYGGIDYKNECRFLGNTHTPPPEGTPVEVALVRLPQKEKAIARGVYSVKRHNEAFTKSRSAAYEEGLMAAEKIKGMLGKPYTEGGITKTVRYSDIAVLFVKRSGGADAYLSALSDSGIPYVSSGFLNDAGKGYIKQLLCMLKTLDNARQDIPFAGFALSWFGGLTEGDLAEIRLKYPKEFLYDGVCAYATGNDILCKKCAAVVSFIEKYRKTAAFIDVGELLDRAIGDTGFDAYVLSRQQGSLALRAVYEYIDGIRRSGRGGSVQSWLSFAGGENNEIEAPDGELGNAVRISTVHGSKGLEYPVVILARVDADWRGQTENADIVLDKDLGIGIKLYNEAQRVKAPSLSYLAITKTAAKRELDEKIRLFYVALTRAKAYLVITGVASGDIWGKLNAPSSAMNAKSFLDLLCIASSRDGGLKKLLSEAEVLPVECEEAVVPVFEIGAPEEKYLRLIEERVNYSYPYAAATEVSPKYTVSDLNRGREETEYVPALSGGDDNLKKGIAYHTVMENIDFGATTLYEVEECIERLERAGYIATGEGSLVSAAQILNCITSPVIKDGVKGSYIREKSFTLKIPACDVLDTCATDKILVQGTVDLAIFGQTNILVDFKYSSLPDDTLAVKYEKQLNLYKMAIERAYGIKIHKKLLYSFKSGHFIDIK